MLTDLLAGYAAQGDRYDELLAAPGAPRPHWDAFMRSLAERGEREVSDKVSLSSPPSRAASARRKPSQCGRGCPGADSSSS